MSFSGWILGTCVFIFLVLIVLGIGWWIRNKSNSTPAPPNKYNSPQVWGPPLPSNRETVSYTDIMDKSVFMFGFGTPVRYQTYEIDDLIAAFYRDAETGASVFRRPESQNQQFTEDEMDDLDMFLVEINSFTPGANDLRRRISDIKHIREDMTVTIRKLTTKFRTFPAVEQMLVKEFLKSLFFAGMYMRRWKGPGNPFPITEQETLCKTDPEPLVQENLSLGRDILNRMVEEVRTFVLNLYTIQYNRDGSIEIEKQKFSEEWNAVVAGTQCIRMASTKFVGTCVFYLKEFFEEEIPGMTGPVARIQ